MIKYLKTTTVATMAILTMLNTGAVFAQSNNDSETKESAAIVTADKLNVRSGPSTSHDIVGSFSKNDGVDLLSIKNGWVDENGRVFIYYSVIKICEILNCGTQKACKLLDELETFGALERRRQGLGKPNRLYLKKVF